MATTFYIPRQTDLEILASLSRVLASGGWNPALNISVHLDHHGWVPLPDEHPETFEQIQFALKLNSTVFNHFVIKNPHRNALTINRDLLKPWDTLTVTDDWIIDIPDAQTRSRHYAELVASARAELKAHDLDASLKGAGDNAWNRYREAQMAVVNSLQQASETLLIKTADKNSELDRIRSARFEQLETGLRQEISEERKKLQGEFVAKEKTLADQIKELTDREAAFETKESHYVGRQKQGEQITQIQNWLKDWHLTQGTHKKRAPIFWAYVTALVLTGFITIFSIWHSYDLLKTADDLAKIQWWQWVALTLKTLFPVAAFTTFMIYFIRWTGDWARQHAEEEFRNRTRLIDIGRSSWLLEAVRDSQERDKEIPADLLKELSRNLFANNSTNDPDIHPKAAADILMQGLSSIRVKSPDGAEVEAKRGKT